MRSVFHLGRGAAHDVPPPLLLSALRIAKSAEALDASVRTNADFADIAEWVFVQTI